MIAATGDPGHTQSFRVKWLHRLVEHAWMSRKSECVLKGVTVGRAIRFPVDVTPPIGPLHSVVTGRPRIRTHRASTEESEEVGQLVVLRVVDGVARHDRHLQWAARHGSGLD